MTTSLHVELSAEEIQDLINMVDDHLRADKTERERRSRQRRVTRMDGMREQIRALGHVALTLPMLSDADEIWDAFLDDDAKRIRSLLRRLEPAVAQVQTLVKEKDELRQQLKEHEDAIHAIKKALESADNDGWIGDVRRWKALARMVFKPWSMDQCLHEIQAAVRAAETANARVLTEAMNPTFMDWDESRHTTGSVLDFGLRKRFHDSDLDRAMTTCWNMFTDATQYASIVHGGKTRASLDVLQDVSPGIQIVHFQERHHDTPATFHSLVLVARVETAQGATLILRSVDAPGVVEATSGPCEVWTTASVWIQWSIEDLTKPRSATDFETCVGGTIDGVEPQFTKRWCVELLSALVRTETAITGTPLVTVAAP